MQALIIYGVIGLGVVLFLGVFFSLLKLRVRIHIDRHQPSASALPEKEVFYCLKAHVKQLSSDFLVAQLVFSNKKNISLDPQRTPSRFFKEEKN
jgi:hypothetical protein